MGTISTQHNQNSNTPRNHSEIAFLQHIYNVDLLNQEILDQTQIGKARQQVLKSGEKPTRLKIYMRNSARPPCPLDNYKSPEPGKECNKVIEKFRQNLQRQLRINVRVKVANEGSVTTQNVYNTLWIWRS